MQKSSAKFFAKDPISNNLLASIPIKVKRWLEQIPTVKDRHDFLTDGEFNGLRWLFTAQKYTIEFSDDHTGEFATIEWARKKDGAISIGGDQEWFEDVTSNMDKFIALEKQIYDTLEELLESSNE